MSNYNNDETKIIQRGEVWLAELGKGVGSEQQGSRPVLIMQNNLGNKYSNVITVVPLTSQIKRTDLPVHVSINNRALVRNSVALVEQVRSVSTERLVAKLCRVTKAEQELVSSALKRNLEI